MSLQLDSANYMINSLCRIADTLILYSTHIAEVTSFNDFTKGQLANQLDTGRIIKTLINFLNG